MADERLQNIEDPTPILVQEAIYDLPEWVWAELPTEDELGVEDDKPVQSTQHREQSDLLLHLLKRVWPDRDDICIAGDLAVHYMHKQPPVVPDVMMVFGVPRRQRKAYLMWKEGKRPDFVIELLSESNPTKDTVKNYSLYEQQLGVPEYVWFNPLEPTELRGFRLRGNRYEEITPDQHGRLWSEVLELYLGVHEGWLRLYDRHGNLILTGDEAETQQRARATQAEERAAQERAAREAAEAELVRLREELARLKADEIRNA
jgi:Uma2 family endonuclease